MMMSIYLRSLLAALLLASAPWAQALVFAVNEGVTYRVPAGEVRARYATMASDLSKLLKQPVTVEPVADYAALRKGLAEKTYDLAMVHPAHVSIVALRQSGYQLVAVTKGYEQYQASVLVRADSPFKTIADLKGRRLGLPEEDSVTVRMVRATLRDAKVDPNGMTLTYTRYQDAVPFFIDNRLTDAGVTGSSSLVQAWQAKGGRVLAQSKPVPIKHIIASPNLPADQVAKVRDYLISLDATEEGKKKLESMNYAGFDRYDGTALLAIGTWLGL